MQKGMQTALLILLTVIIFVMVLSIAIRIRSGQDVEIINKLVKIISLKYVGN